jgi:tetratricopeptide (TPR) repeat protein
MGKGVVKPNGDKIKRLRMAKLLTQEECATKADCSKRTIEKLEAGHPATFPTIRAIARVLEVEASAIMASPLSASPERGGDMEAKDLVLDTGSPPAEAVPRGLAAVTNAADIEITINCEFDKFTSEQQEQLLAAIKRLLETTHEIRVIKKRRGSVKLTIRLTPDEAEKLQWAIKAERLAQFGVTDARITATHTTAASTDTPSAPGDAPPARPGDSSPDPQATPREAQAVASLIDLGVELVEKKQYHDALACMNRVIELDPHDAGGWSGKAAALLAIHRLHDEGSSRDQHLTQALRCARRANELSTSDPATWANLGIILFEHGSHSEALVSIDHALGIDRDNQFAWFNKGVMLYRLGKHEAAIAALEVAMKLGHSEAAFAISEARARKWKPRQW